MKRLFIGLTLALAASVTQAGTAPQPAATRTIASGTLIRYDRFPSTNIAARTIYVWTPRDYAPSGRRYDVLYMADGQNLFETGESFGGQSWEIARHLQALIDAGKVRPTIIVGVWNTGKDRGREYAPAGGQTPQGLALLAKDWGGPIASDDYVRFLTTELKPFIDRHYRTNPGRAHTFLMGSSMGGLISLYAFVKRPDLFGGAACLSTHWPIRAEAAFSDPEGAKPIADAFLRYVDAHLPPADHRRLYFDRGTKTYDAYYGAYQARMDAILKRHHYAAGRNALSLVFPGAAHREADWRARIDRPLIFLLGK